MRWFDKMDLLNKLYIKKPDDTFYLLQRHPPVRRIWGAPPAKSYKSKEEQQLLQDLLKRYPDLKYVNFNYEEPNLYSTEGNYVLDFLKYQKSLMNKGYTKEKAFELTEKKFHEKLTIKINESLIANNLAYDNHSRSLLTIAEQSAEAESRFKVDRMTRDLYFYKLAKIKEQKTLKDFEREILEEEEEEESEENLNGSKEKPSSIKTESNNKLEDIDDAELDELFETEYTRVLHKIVPKKGTSVEEPKTIGDRKEAISQFIENSKNMFNLYYNRAAALDRLSGLKDNEIMSSVAPRPSRMKKEAKSLLTKLKKYNITLTNKGEVDFSKCPHPNVIKQLQGNPLVKIVLLQDALEYEFPHKEVQMELAKKIREDYDDYKAEAERLRKLREKPEAEDTAIATDDSPFHKHFGISYPKTKLYKGDRAKESKPVQDITDTDLLSPEATYRVFESYPERIARLEKKWLQNRLASLEPGIEKPSSTEQLTLITQAVDKLRRAKFLIDQKNVENAKDLIFEEHKVYTKEELLADSQIHHENLIHYMRNPEEKRRLTQRDEVDDDKLMAMISRKEIIEDTVQPFENYADQRLEEEDTREAAQLKIRKRQQEAEMKKLSQPSDGEEGFEEDPVLLGKTASKEKSEKKKVVEYIKQQSEKNAKKSVKGKQEEKKAEKKPKK